MIIVSITGPDLAMVRKQVRRSSPYADVFEFRLDLIKKPDVRTLLHLTDKPVVMTCRPAWEGGGYKGSEESRLALLESALDAGARYIDLELRAGIPALRRFIEPRKGKQILLSLHLFDSVPADVSALYRRMRKPGAEVIKLAFQARDASDNSLAAAFLRMASNDRQKAVGIAMGESGESSRVLYRKFGGWATYASPLNGDAAAPGQIDARTLRTIYRANALTKSTRVYGVIGNPLGQSKGVLVHNELFRALGQNRVYCKFPVLDLARFARTMMPILSGFSVTLPFKQRIIRSLDEIEKGAREIGAVNTVVRVRNRLIGRNSDAAGALDAIEERRSVGGRTLLVIGSGGAARAIAYEAIHRGARVTLTNRTEKKGRELARKLGIRFDPSPDFGTYEIIANSTSLGMTPHTHETPVPRSALHRGMLVFDAVYNPPVTRLLREAREKGATIVSGVEMYVNQAAAQSRLFAGVPPRRSRIKKLLLHALHESGRVKRKATHS